jgi:hypothetical protein
MASVSQTIPTERAAPVFLPVIDAVWKVRERTVDCNPGSGNFRSRGSFKKIENLDRRELSQQRKAERSVAVQPLQVAQAGRTDLAKNAQ